MQELLQRGQQQQDFVGRSVGRRPSLQSGKCAPGVPRIALLAGMVEITASQLHRHSRVAGVGDELLAQTPVFCTVCGYGRQCLDDFIVARWRYHRRTSVPRPARAQDHQHCASGGCRPAQTPGPLFERPVIARPGNGRHVRVADARAGRPLSA